MANGSFQNFVNSTLGLYCEYSWSQNVSGNYSDVTVSVWAKYYSLDIGSRSGGSVTVNGTSNSFSTSEIHNYPSGGGGVTKLTQQTIRVAHNSDGTKTGVGISVYWPVQVTYAGTYYGSISASTTINLPTIPRASSITSAGNITLGNACNIKWTPASSSFKYKIQFSLGSWNVTTGFISPNTTSAYTYTGYTISGTTIANNTTIYAQLPSSTSGTMTAVLTTYNSSGTQIGSTSSKTFTVSIPSSVVPTVGAITLDPADINSQNILVQGKNKITVSVSGCSAGTGSSIKSYTFSGPGISSTTTATSVTSSSTISNTGTLTYTVTVTDNRGRTASKTATITCYAYSSPYFSSFNAYRSNSSGTADNSGTYIKCSYSLGFSSVNSTNDVTVKIYYKKNSATSYSSTTALTNSTATSGSNILSSIALDSTYTVYATVTDNYSGSSSTTTITIFGASRILNVLKSGEGVAFGTMAETEKLFYVKWPIKSGDPINTLQNFSYRGSNLISSTANDTTANWNNQGNLATTFYTATGKINGQPSQYGFLLNLTTGPGGQEAHQLWLAQNNGNMYHRGGNSSGMATSWKTCLDSSNYTSYVSTKPTTLYSSTGTTGTITLSSSAANFTYLEIFYTDNNSRQPQSIKLYSPDGKYVSLSCVEPSTSGTEPRAYIRTSGWTISGTTMTPGRSDLDGANRGVYAQIYPHASGTNIDVNVTANNYIKIVRILGYA